MCAKCLLPVAFNHMALGYGSGFPNIRPLSDPISRSRCQYRITWEMLKHADLTEMEPIMKTCLYNFDPLKPHFYIVKLGFTGVYIIFLISAQNIDCGYSLELPRWGNSNEYPQSMFLSRNMKNISVLYLKIFSFWRWNFLYIWIGVFS